ncbi:ATP phosphoribosyltransferase regulatory subunit [Heliophilum fasciatum]|uniref:ATP phosphoribosyltransferase regulatory subunit n=1 Tax=Heliophilum fasciatum TaxID=35700 RepID=A0A4R2RN08_9FIRM|nr:ATP phosphoribosyltransferase regulatory subunit [Heliophilum fasciatum]MCW2278022.1 ATP phosphoribosyltransferase regulatory subunit [Heliophilum fasciatum]TCP64358.1 ATP phosphoribosyltransferase regulatory subunit [Heliophilum fasciatum]
MKEGNGLQIPAGMRDLLPGVACDQRQLESRCTGLFTSWGYQEVITPTLEYLDAITIDTGEEIRDHLFQLFDRQGKILALRPEMTTPIARVVATRLRGAALPLRLCYAANVFRYEEPQAGRQREIAQAGVEMIGAATPLADAEVIALAVEAIKQSGLEDFQISLGQIEIFNGLMEELPLTVEQKSKVRTLVAKKDFVSLEELLNSYGITGAPADRILQLPTLHGGAEVLEQAAWLGVNDRARQGLENLRQVYQALASFGVSDFVALDLGVLRGFDYYTGIVFEGYTVGLGFPICGGGRYDNLLGQLGYPCPATGFALGLDRILLALARTNPPARATSAVYLIGGDDTAAMLNKATQLRSQGLSVEIDVLGRDEASLQAYAQTRGITQVQYCRQGG